MSVATYFGKLSTLWEELNHHEPLITCACCSASRGKATDSDERPLKEDKSHLHCTYCKKTGHLEKSCFEIIGYPEWWPNKSKANTGGAGKSSQTGGRGRGSTRANATMARAGRGASSMGGSSQAFSADQWKALAGLIGNTKIPDDRLNGKFDNKLWIVDTGASRHVTCHASWLFHTHEVHHCPVGLPNGKSVMATKEGSVQLSSKITLKNVLLVPELSCNLISVTQLIDDLQCTVQFNDSMCAIQDHSRMLIGTSIRRDGLYYFDGEASVQHVTTHGSSSILELWHKRMGHPSEKVVKLLPPVNDRKGSLTKPCEVCFRAKHPRDKFPLSENKASRIFEKVHCDLWGPYRHPSSCGARYFLTIVDDFSRAVWIYLLVDKTEVFRMFMSFFAMVDRQFSQTIKVVQSDNGTEFNCLKDFFNASGILFQTSCVGTPQQNGRVERKQKHILNVGRALRFQANLPIHFWGESVLVAAYLINRTPSSLLQNKTPYEFLFGTSPTYNTIRTFGCLCFAHNQKAKGDKFVSRSRKCIFVGYPYNKKGWRLFDLDTKEFFVSRDVKFFEDLFPFDDPNPSNFVPATMVPMNDVVDADFEEYVAENNVPQQAIDIEVHEDVGAEKGLGVDDAQHTASTCAHPTQQQQAAGTHGQAVRPASNPHQISADSRGAWTLL
ncbi:hypothetical protein DCAR_0519401 [Daucus carota subsp. sativus]|uniref:Integrase catalytic domain-containing protein n=1 Tax=Daucus carota subsp. sativus TaxID=79200 RepID=A0AAF0X276_DAUCS|nr:hypothetical protein DCAR_0519401 [Daucus carota subsp. sativus]